MNYGGETTCPSCGRKLDGVSTIFGIKWRCSKCVGDKTDPIHCERGCKVEFAYPDSGREGQRKLVGEILTIGEIYEVESVAVDSCYSEIELKEFPGRKFNSVFFRRVV